MLLAAATRTDVMPPPNGSWIGRRRFHAPTQRATLAIRQVAEHPVPQIGHEFSAS